MTEVIHLSKLDQLTFLSRFARTRLLCPQKTFVPINFRGNCIIILACVDENDIFLNLHISPDPLWLWPNTGIWDLHSSFPDSSLLIRSIRFVT